MRRRYLLLAVLVLAGWMKPVHAGHPYDPADPRPDFLPHTLYYAHDSYRKTYNRPRFIPGYLGSKFEPSSQEAMSWKDSYCGGWYGTHCKTPVPHYYYPKPWEALNVGPRRDSRIPPTDPSVDPKPMDSHSSTTPSEAPSHSTRAILTAAQRDPSR